MYKRVMLGEIVNAAQAAPHDLTRRESVILLPIVILIFWMGLAPGGFLRVLDGTAEAILPVAPVGVLEE
jgi:NADH-quinone oxidoreductase subunit M